MKAKLRRTSDGRVQIPREASRIAISTDDFAILSEGEGVNRRARFKMLANSGKPIAHPWFGMLGINLSGITWAEDSRIPVLLDHDTGRRLGYTEKLAVTKRGLEAEGALMSNPDGAAVARESDEGFPWQASVYLRATKVTEIKQGVECECNGHKFTGPGIVFEASELREVTFCALGADPNTSAATLADSGDGDVAELTQTEDDTMDPEELKKQEAARLAAEAKAAADKAATEKREAETLATLREQARKEETERVAAIFAAAATEQAQLAAQLVKDGKTLNEALLALNADLRERLTAKGGVKPSGAPAPKAGEKPAPKTEQKLTGRALLQQQWDTDEKLRDEFGSAGNWFAYSENQHRCRNYGSRSEEGAPQRQTEAKDEANDEAAA